MFSKLIEFFKSYQHGFDRICPEDIALHYKLPCMISDIDGLMCYDSLDKLTQKFASNCQKIKDMGYAGSRLSINEMKSLGEQTASVDISWQVQLESGPYNFRTFYLCHNENEEWKILNAIVYEAVR